MKKKLVETVRFNCDGVSVSIRVPDDIKAYFNSQYVREHPTEGFKRRYATLRYLMRLAYRQGLADGQRRRDDEADRGFARFSADPN